MVPSLLNSIDMMHAIFGPTLLETASKLLNSASNRMVPAWNKHMPKGASPLRDPVPPVEAHADRKVVYLPTCVTRVMGPSRVDPEQDSVHEKLLSLFHKVSTWPTTTPPVLGFETLRADDVASLMHPMCVVTRVCHVLGETNDGVRGVQICHGMHVPKK